MYVHVYDHTITKYLKHDTPCRVAHVRSAPQTTHPFRRARELFESDARWKAVPEREREELFHDAQRERDKRDKEERRQVGGGEAGVGWGAGVGDWVWDVGKWGCGYGEWVWGAGGGVGGESGNWEMGRGMCVFAWGGGGICVSPMNKFRRGCSGFSLTRHMICVLLVVPVSQRHYNCPNTRTREHRLCTALVSHIAWTLTHSPTPPPRHHTPTPRHRKHCPPQERKRRAGAFRDLLEREGVKQGAEWRKVRGGAAIIVESGVIK